MTSTWEEFTLFVLAKTSNHKCILDIKEMNLKFIKKVTIWVFPLGKGTVKLLLWSLYWQKETHN